MKLTDRLKNYILTKTQGARKYQTDYTTETAYMILVKMEILRFPHRESNPGHGGESAGS